MRGIIFFIFVSAVLVISGCSLKFEAARLADTGGFDQAVEVKCIKQSGESRCALAAAEIIADYYGKTLNAVLSGTLSKRADQTGDISAGDLKGMFEASGFDTAVFPGKLDLSFSGIYRQLKAKHPVIVLLCDKPYTVGHYVVVFGYDTGRGLLAIMDPAKCSYILTDKEFMMEWDNAKNLTILALP